MKTGRKPFTVDVQESISEEFSQLVEDEGFLKWKATGGALLAYIALPDAVRAFLNKDSTTSETARRFVTDYYRDLFEKGMISPEINKKTPKKERKQGR